MQINLNMRGISFSVGQTKMSIINYHMARIEFHSVHFYGVEHSFLPQMANAGGFSAQKLKLIYGLC